MSPELIGLIGLIILLTLLFCRTWIGLAMALVGFLGIACIRGFDTAFMQVGMIPYRQAASYPLSAIPLFVMMGMVVFEMGFATDLFHTAYKWIGQVRGGLAIASAFASSILGVVTDSMVAVITLGKAAVPEMKKYNYDESLATASIVAGASLASLIPPSTTFILYCILTQNSIGEMFIAAVIPGIVLTILIILTIMLLVKINPNLAPAGPKTSFKEKMVSLKYTWAVLVLVVMIIAGIYGGVFTPTEAGGIGAFGSILIAAASRRLTIEKLKTSTVETMLTTGMILLIIIGAFIFMNFMALSNIPTLLGKSISQLSVSPYVSFIGIVIIYFILGMFTDIMASIILTMPVFYPMVLALGFDPIWYGVVIIIVMELGLITPPVGFNVFMLSGISGTPMGTIFRGVWPFVLLELLFVALLAAFPQIVLFLPSMMA